MTKILKKLRIEVIEYDFRHADESLEIYTTIDGEEINFLLARKELLDILERTFIIDSYKGDQVIYSTCDDFYDPREPDGHGQVEHTYRATLDSFMDEDFHTDDAYRIVEYLEKHSYEN